MFALFSYGIIAWDDGDNTNAGDHIEAENKLFNDQGYIRWSHVLRVRMHMDWATVINNERVDNGHPVLLWSNVKFIHAMICV